VVLEEQIEDTDTTAKSGEKSISKDDLETYVYLSGSETPSAPARLAAAWPTSGKTWLQSLSSGNWLVNPGGKEKPFHPCNWRLPVR